MDKMREAFEAEAVSRGFPVQRAFKHYNSQKTELCWEIWQAALTRQPESEPVAWMVDEQNQIGGLSTRLHWARNGGIPPAFGCNHKPLYTSPQPSPRPESEPVYVVVAGGIGPGEEFVEIENAQGESIRVPHSMDGDYRRIGPLYASPQPTPQVPEYPVALLRRIDSFLTEAEKTPDFLSPNRIGPLVADVRQALKFAPSKENNDE